MEGRPWGSWFFRGGPPRDLETVPSVGGRSLRRLGAPRAGAVDCGARRVLIPPHSPSSMVCEGGEGGPAPPPLLPCLDEALVTGWCSDDRGGGMRGIGGGRHSGAYLPPLPSRTPRSAGSRGPPPRETGSRRVGAAPLAGFVRPTGASGITPSVRTGRGPFGGPGLSGGVWGGFAAMCAPRSPSPVSREDSRRPS